MKVRASVKRISEACRLVRRKGRVYIVDKKNPVGVAKAQIDQAKFLFNNGKARQANELLDKASITASKANSTGSGMLTVKCLVENNQFVSFMQRYGFVKMLLNDKMDFRIPNSDELK